MRRAGAGPSAMRRVHTTRALALALAVTVGVCAAGKCGDLVDTEAICGNPALAALCTHESQGGCGGAPPPSCASPSPGCACAKALPPAGCARDRSVPRGNATALRPGRGRRAAQYRSIALCSRLSRLSRRRLARVSETGAVVRGQCPILCGICPTTTTTTTTTGA